MNFCLSLCLHCGVLIMQPAITEPDGWVETHFGYFWVTLIWQNCFFLSSENTSYQFEWTTLSGTLGFVSGRLLKICLHWNDPSCYSIFSTMGNFFFKKIFENYLLITLLFSELDRFSHVVAV